MNGYPDELLPSILHRRSRLSLWSGLSVNIPRSPCWPGSWILEYVRQAGYRKSESDRFAWLKFRCLWKRLRRQQVFNPNARTNSNRWSYPCSQRGSAHTTGLHSRLGQLKSHDTAFSSCHCRQWCWSSPQSHMTSFRPVFWHLRTFIT